MPFGMVAHKPHPQGTTEQLFTYKECLETCTAIHLASALTLWSPQSKKIGNNMAIVLSTQ